MHAKNLSQFLNGLSNKKEPRLISSKNAKGTEKCDLIGQFSNDTG